MAGRSDEVEQAAKLEKAPVVQLAMPFVRIWDLALGSKPLGYPKVGGRIGGTVPVGEVTVPLRTSCELFLGIVTGSETRGTCGFDERLLLMWFSP